eukprot:933-Heterococcus_DN1.PRE.1
MSCCVDSCSICSNMTLRNVDVSGACLVQTTHTSLCHCKSAMSIHTLHRSTTSDRRVEHFNVHDDCDTFHRTAQSIAHSKAKPGCCASLSHSTVPHFTADGRQHHSTEFANKAAAEAMALPLRTGYNARTVYRQSSVH